MSYINMVTVPGKLAQTVRQKLAEAATQTSIHIVYFLLPWKAGDRELNDPSAT